MESIRFNIKWHLALIFVNAFTILVASPFSSLQAVSIYTYLVLLQALQPIRWLTCPTDACRTAITLAELTSFFRSNSWIYKCCYISKLMNARVCTLTLTSCWRLLMMLSVNYNVCLFVRVLSVHWLIHMVAHVLLNTYQEINPPFPLFRCN